MSDWHDEVFLVGFAVQWQGKERTREEVEAWVRSQLPDGGMKITPTGDVVDLSWWVAEDDRTDGSDNDSAVFVNMGDQPAASRLLHNFFLTGKWNIKEEPSTP